MHIDVSLCGHVSPWRFRGSATFDRWLDSQPWLVDGGVRILHVRNDEAVLARATDAARSAILARNCARNNLQPYLLTPNGPDELASQLWSRLSVCDELAEFQRLLEAARRFEEQKFLFLVNVDGTNAASIVDSADMFVERIEKVGGRVRPMFVFLLGATAGVRGIPDDFISGWPIGCDPLLASNRESEAWAAYLHARIAWESGGNVLLAESWAKQIDSQSLQLGEDGKVETCLNAFAKAAYELLDSSLRAHIEAQIVLATKNTQAMETVWQPWEELRRLGLVWHIPGSELASPTPWLARALLLARKSGPLHSQLRNCLICAPLARQLLAASFDLEAYERSLLMLNLPYEARAPAVVQDRFERFRRREPFSGVEFYPFGCPAIPDDVWHFCTWGEIVELATRFTNETRTRTRHALRTLRNALAHGDYVSWIMIRRVFSIRQDLGFTATP